jgi:hypothetical protein
MDPNRRRRSGAGEAGYLPVELPAGSTPFGESATPRPTVLLRLLLGPYSAASAVSSDATSERPIGSTKT